MVCPKCEGKGWIRNPRWTGGSCDVYPISYKCKFCEESGYVIGNVRDVLDYMNFLLAQHQRMGDKEGTAKIKRCISIITKN